MGKLSVMVQMQPTGLGDYVAMAKPTGLYCINNRVKFSGVQTILRIQNKNDDTGKGWGRLPDACSTQEYWVHEDPIRSAHHELLEKTIFVQGRGNLNLIQYWMLSQERAYAPYNEWVLGDGDDRFARADWMNAWTCEALRIANQYELPLCVGSFETGTPRTDVLSHLHDMFALAKLYNGFIDTHAYGVKGPMETSPSSGALHHREWYPQLPEECKAPLVFSEFWWGNGFEDFTDHEAQVRDAEWFGTQIAQDSYVAFACAFQLGETSESHITYDALMMYAAIAEPDPPDPPVVYTCRTDYPFPSRGLMIAQNASEQAIQESTTLWRQLKTNIYYSGNDLLHMAYASDNAGYPAEVHIWEPQLFPGGKQGVIDWLAPTHANITYHMEITPPTPPSKFVSFGLGMGTTPVTNKQRNLIRYAFGSDPHPSFLFLTLTDPTQMNSTIQNVKSAIPNGSFMGRLWCPFNPNHVVTPEEFVSYVRNGMDVLYANGIRTFTVHNEPNLESEGLGTTWHDATEFMVWVKHVLTILRSMYPSARFLAPALSPKPNVPEWLQTWKSLGAQAQFDGFCFHAYWQTVQGGLYNMNDRSGGLAWLIYRDIFGDVPLYGTEVSNNAYAVPKDQKGREYKQYRELLKQYGISWCAIFVVKWNNTYGEDWVNAQDNSTGIAEGYVQ